MQNIYLKKSYQSKQYQKVRKITKFLLKTAWSAFAIKAYKGINMYGIMGIRVLINETVIMQEYKVQNTVQRNMHACMYEWTTEHLYSQNICIYYYIWVIFN